MDFLNLQKGDILDLTKTSTSPLTTIAAGAGWDMAAEGAAIDIDLSAIVLRGGKLLNSSDVCYFGQKSVLGGTVQSAGDNLTGEGEGDDETITVKLSELPDDVTDVVFILNIYDAVKKGQSFNQVSNAFIRVYNTETSQELGKVNVSDITDSYDSLVFAKASRTADGWSFEAIKDFKNADLNGLAAMYK